MKNLFFSLLFATQCFSEMIMILFYIKVNVLQRKLSISSVKYYFPNFKGNTLNPEAVKVYIRTRFVSLGKILKTAIQVCFTDMRDDTSLGISAFTALERSMKLKEGWIQSPTQLSLRLPMAQRSIAFCVVMF